MEFNEPLRKTTDAMFHLTSFDLEESILALK